MNSVDNTVSRHSRYNITFSMKSWPVSVFFSLIFSFIIVLIPWESIKGSGFRDVENYVARIEIIKIHGLPNIFEIEGWYRVFLDERLWSEILWLIAESSIDPEVAILWISFFTAFVYFYFTARTTGALLAALLLTSPPLIDLVMGQVRSATAFSLALIVMMRSRSKFFLITTAFAATVHTSMAAVFSIFIVSYGVNNSARISDKRKVYFVLIVSVLIGILIGEFASGALKSYGDRRDFDSAGSRSVLFVLFWGLLSIYLTAMTPKNHPFLLEHLISVSVLSASFSMEAIGFPAFRLIAMALPIILTSVYRLSPTPRKVGLLALFSYNLVQFSYWI